MEAKFRFSCMHETKSLCLQNTGLHFAFTKTLELFKGVMVPETEMAIANFVMCQVEPCREDFRSPLKLFIHLSKI